MTVALVVKWKHGNVDNSKPFVQITAMLKSSPGYELVGMWSNLLESPSGFTWFDHVTNQVHGELSNMLLISYIYFLEKIKKRHFHEYQFIAAQNIYVKKELETMVLPITVLTHIFNIL